jgi:hypothetical protein
MKLERRSPSAATNENAGLQSGFENGMLKPSKTQITPRHERIQICVSGVRPAHEVRLVAERHGDGMPDLLPENHRPASA